MSKVDNLAKLMSDRDSAHIAKSRYLNDAAKASKEALRLERRAEKDLECITINVITCSLAVKLIRDAVLQLHLQATEWRARADHAMQLYQEADATYRTISGRIALA